MIDDGAFTPDPDHSSSEVSADDYTVEGTVIVIADTAAARSRAAAAAMGAGLRVLARLDLHDAMERLDARASSSLVFVEMDEVAAESAPAFERLLVRLNEDAASGRLDAIVSTPSRLIDLVAAHAVDARVHQLADATDMERVAVLALAAAPQPVSFRDSASENADTVRLARLTDEVARIAGALARLSSSATAVGIAPGTAPSDPTAGPIDAEQIRGMIRARRMRAQFFDAELFADPAWDMLLDLAAAHADGQRIAVSSLCIAAAVPATTALRWIRTLTQTGLFVRQADPADGRRVFVELGDGAAQGMRGYLEALRRLANARGMNLAQIAV